MRKITPKEIDAAPGWAVSYHIGGIDEVLTYHESHYVFTLPLPDKAPFDITQCKHLNRFEFLVLADQGRLLEVGHNKHDILVFNKDQIIEAAKILKLTASDLKQ